MAGQHSVIKNDWCEWLNFFSLHLEICILEKILFCLLK